MNKITFSGYLCIILISFAVIYAIIKIERKKENCKLEKISVLIFSIIIEKTFIIMFNLGLLIISLDKSVRLILSKSTLLFFLILMTIIFLIKVLLKIKVKYKYHYIVYSISIITLIEALILKIYPFYRRGKNGFYRILRELIKIIPGVSIKKWTQNREYVKNI